MNRSPAVASGLPGVAGQARESGRRGACVGPSHRRERRAGAGGAGWRSARQPRAATTAALAGGRTALAALLALALVAAPAAADGKRADGREGANAPAALPGALVPIGAAPRVAVPPSRQPAAPAPSRPFADFLSGFDARSHGSLWEVARRFYAGRGERPTWIADDGRPTRAARALVEALSDAGSHGLDPTLYGAADLAAALDEALAAPPDGDAAFALEVRLTGAFLLHADHLAHGRAPAVARWAGDWPRRRLDLGLALAGAAEGRPAEALAGLAPSAPAARRLAAALADHRALAADGGWGEIADGPVMKEGDPVAAERHRALVARLAITGDLAEDDARQLGLDPPEYRERRGLLSWLRGQPPPDEAGTAAVEAPPLLYDERLADAVRRFQRRHGLTVDGVVGRDTLAALNVPVEARIATLALDFERWRWLADDLGPRHVLVDLGGQELVAFEAGRTALRMNVVVGTPRTPSPTLASEIAYLVVNPSWYVPASIVYGEIEPKLSRDPGYLRRNGYERLSNGLLRQRPGPGNALGQLKFIFPNRHSVYLHDTPSKHLFERPTRAFSHGCIRIANPRGLADWLLADQPQLADLDRILDRGVEHRIDLDRKVPVYLLYWTSSVGEDGVVRFHQDVYGRNERLRAAL